MFNHYKLTISDLATIEQAVNDNLGAGESYFTGVNKGNNKVTAIYRALEEAGRIPAGLRRNGALKHPEVRQKVRDAYRLNIPAPKYDQKTDGDKFAAVESERVVIAVEDYLAGQSAKQVSEVGDSRVVSIDPDRRPNPNYRQDWAIKAEAAIPARPALECLYCRRPINFPEQGMMAYPKAAGKPVKGLAHIICSYEIDRMMGALDA